MSLQRLLPSRICRRAWIGSLLLAVGCSSESASTPESDTGVDASADLGADVATDTGTPGDSGVDATDAPPTCSNPLLEPPACTTCKNPLKAAPDCAKCVDKNKAGEACDAQAYRSISLGGVNLGVKADGTLTVYGGHGTEVLVPWDGAEALKGFFSGWCGVKTGTTNLVCYGSGFPAAPAEVLASYSIGGQHGCGLLASGEVRCWGKNDRGQATAPTGTFKLVTTGQNHSCAIATDGSLKCWGDNTSGQATAPTGTFKAVSCGWTHTCAIDSADALVCFGASTGDLTAAPKGTFKAVAAGAEHSCALTLVGDVACWGALELFPPPKGPFVAIYGEQLTGQRIRGCALRADGEALCWGRDSFGKAGVFRF